MVSYALAAGNARMAAFAGAHQGGVVARAGILSDAQATEAIDWTNGKYDALSVGILQHIAAVPASRTMDEPTAQAVANFQRARGLLVDGKVGHQTLTAAFPERVNRDAHDQLIHIVADLEDIDITTEISAVQFDETLTTRGATRFEPSGLRVIRLGRRAFQSSRILRDTINAQKQGAAPGAPAAGAAPAILDPVNAGLSTIFNQSRLGHPNSPRAVGGLIGAPRTNTWTEDLVQRVAGFQTAAALPATGLVDEGTLRALVAGLIAAGDNNGAIRLIVDFFDFDDAGNLISIYFDPNETANAETLPLSSGEENQPASIQVGPAGMAQPFAGLVHTIEHEFVHVRLMRENEMNIPTQEFLAEADGNDERDHAGRGHLPGSRPTPTGGSTSGTRCRSTGRSATATASRRCDGGSGSGTRRRIAGRPGDAPTDAGPLERRGAAAGTGARPAPAPAGP